MNKTRVGMNILSGMAGIFSVALIGNSVIQVAINIGLGLLGTAVLLVTASGLMGGGLIAVAEAAGEKVGNKIADWRDRRATGAEE